MTGEASSTARRDPTTTPGIVQHAGQLHYVAGVLAEWILDYRAFDPGYDPSRWESLFRGGLLTVRPIDGDAYLTAVRPYEVPHEDLLPLIARDGIMRTRPAVLVDFDSARLTSSYYDVALEDYAGEGWTTAFGDPVAHLPEDWQQLWSERPT